MLDILHLLFFFFVAIFVLVAVHEFGHFWVARRCGVKVLTFSIGMGKPLLKWRDRQGTDYVLAAIPLGGFVKMVGENDEEDIPPEWLEQAFNRKPVSQRMAIVVAGPLANFVLAFVAYWGIYLSGMTGIAPVIGKVDAGSLAATAGIEAGQEIISIDGRETATRQVLAEGLLNRLGETGEMVLEVKYPDSDFIYEVVVDLDAWLVGEDDPNPYKGLGIELYYPPMPAIVGEVFADTPAYQAGLQAGDRVVAVDGQTIENWQELTNYIHARPEQALYLELERDGQVLGKTITPRLREIEGKKIGLIGVANQPGKWPEHLRREQQYGFLEAGVAAGQEVWNKSVFILVSVKKMLTGQISAKNLSGPITIARVADDSARAGFKYFVTILALLSISLGVINLLPIPMLDGGHLLFYLVEATTGKPLPERVQEIGFQLGLVMIISLMAFAIYNDLMRL